VRQLFGVDDRAQKSPGAVKQAAQRDAKPREPISGKTMITL
jgi:hypothetical protein